MKICNKGIHCECLQEQNIEIKFRTCATRHNTFPMSQFGPDLNLVHICSYKCDKQYTKIYKRKMSKLFMLMMKITQRLHYRSYDLKKMKPLM